MIADWPEWTPDLHNAPRYLYQTRFEGQIYRAAWYTNRVFHFQRRDGDYWDTVVTLPNNTDADIKSIMDRLPAYLAEAVL